MLDQESMAVAGLLHIAPRDPRGGVHGLTTAEYGRLRGLENSYVKRGKHMPSDAWRWAARRYDELDLSDAPETTLKQQEA